MNEKNNFPRNIVRILNSTKIFSENKFLKQKYKISLQKKIHFFGFFLTLASTGATAFSSQDPARIVYVGDSIAGETLDVVRFFTQLTGKAAVYDSLYGGLALCDFLEGKPAGMPIEKKLKRLVKDLKPHLMVIQISGNALTACMKDSTGKALIGGPYLTQYYADMYAAANQVTAAAQEAGIARPKIMWVLQGPNRDNRDAPRLLNNGYINVANSPADWDWVSDAGADVSMAVYPYDNAVKDRYQWAQYLPCTSFERSYGFCTNLAFGGVAKLHKDNDSGHFGLDEDNNGVTDSISPGIQRYGMRISSDIIKKLGLQ